MIKNIKVRLNMAKDSNLPTDGNMEDELRSSSMRLRLSVRNAFNAIIEKEGWENQDAALENLCRLWTIENQKKDIPERLLEIEDFQFHVAAIQDSFIASLSLYKSTDSRVRESFKSTFEEKEKRIKELVQKCESLESEKNLLDTLYKEARDKKISAQAEVNRIETEMKKTEDLYQEYRNKVEDMKKLLNNYEDGIARLQAVELELAEKISENSVLQDQLNKTIIEHDKQKAKYDSDLERMKSKAESDLEIAVLKTKNEYKDKIAELNDGYSKEFKNHITDMEALKNSLNEKQKEIDRLQSLLREYNLKNEEEVADS